MKLIIGLNSSIVKNVSKKLKGFEIISHREIRKKDLNKYDFIFLFSWPRVLNKSYWNLIDLIPKKKISFYFFNSGIFQIFKISSLQISKSKVND